MVKICDGFLWIGYFLCDFNCVSPIRPNGLFTGRNDVETLPIRPKPPIAGGNDTFAPENRH